MAISWWRGGTVIHKGQCKQDRGRCQVTALRLTKGVRELKALRHVATWPLGVALPGACRGSWGRLQPVSPEGPGWETTFGASPRSRTGSPTLLSSAPHLALSTGPVHPGFGWVRIAQLSAGGSLGGRGKRSLFEVWWIFAHGSTFAT